MPNTKLGQLKHNLEATSAPGVGDDASAGYSAGSLWLDVTGGAAYCCLGSAAGAAVWSETGGAAATVRTIMGDAWVESFLAPNAANTGDETAATAWAGDAFTLSATGVGSVYNGARFGANNAAHINVGDEMVSTEAGLGDLLAGATLQPFSVVCVYRMDALANRYLFGWGSTTGGTNGAYVALRCRTPEHGLLLVPDGTGAQTNIEPITGLAYDETEKCVIISYAGDGARMRIDTWSYQEGWQTGYNNATLSPGAFTTLTTFCVGGAHNGGSPLAGNGLIPELHIGSAGLTDEQFTAIRAVISATYDDTITPQLTTRTQIISPATATFGSVGDTNGDNGSIMHPSVVRLQHVGASTTYGMLFGHHDGSYIRKATSNAIASGWVVEATAPTGLTIAGLVASNVAYSAGATDEHLSSPHVWWNASEAKYFCMVHCRITGLLHGSVVAESTDFDTWTWSNGGDAVSTPDAVYLRPFQVGSTWYAFEGSHLYKSSDPLGISAYARLSNYADVEAALSFPLAEEGFRHTQTHMNGSTAIVFSSNKKGFRERIVYSTMDTSGADSAWAMSAQSDLIYVYTDEDGAGLPFEIGNGGAIYSTNPERQLRDPHIFVDSDSSKYLFYAQAGESGIGVLDLTAWIAAL